MASLAADPDWFIAQLLERDAAEPSMVVYTSGTTGAPKGALLSSRNALAIAEAMVPLFGVCEGDHMLSYLPLCHVAEKIFAEFLPLVVGATVYFGESIETIREDLREVSPTIFLGVPRIWEKMHAAVTLKMQDSSWLKRVLFATFCTRGKQIAGRRRRAELTAWDRIVWSVGDLLVMRPLQEHLGLRRCRLPVSGAAPISPELLSWFHGIGVPILEGYGMTECAGVSHVNPPAEIRLGSVGRVIEQVGCRVAEDGEILVRGPNVFGGYLHDDEATRQTVDEDGWLHTGDVGAIDEDGYLRITGRKKEIIVTSGGKNLSPERIENALKISPYVKEAVAIGDQRNFVSALIQIDYDAVGDWASRQGIAFTSYSDLASKPEVEQLVGREIDRANDQLARVEHVRAFRIFPKELHQDDGELTATQKVRRRAIGVIAYRAFPAVIVGGLESPLGAVLAGLLLGTLEPFNLQMSVEYIAMVVLGGVGTIFGAVWGAITYTLLSPLAEKIGALLPFPAMFTSENQAALIFFPLLCLFLVYEPLGLFGIWLRIKRYFLAWPFCY